MTPLHRLLWWAFLDGYAHAKDELPGWEGRAAGLFRRKYPGAADLLEEERWPMPKGRKEASHG
jgi:hypothetical protein